MAYTVTQAVAGDKVTFSFGGVATAELFDVNGPGMKADTIDVSNNTTGAGFVESVPGLIDGGEVTFGVNVVTGDGGYASLQSAWAAGTKAACVITWATARTCSFQGIITGLSCSSPSDGKVTAQVTVKVSGLPTFTITA